MVPLVDPRRLELYLRGLASSAWLRCAAARTWRHRNLHSLVRWENQLLRLITCRQECLVVFASQFNLCGEVSAALQVRCFLPQLEITSQCCGRSVINHSRFIYNMRLTDVPKLVPVRKQHPPASWDLTHATSYSSAFASSTTNVAVMNHR